MARWLVAVFLLAAVVAADESKVIELNEDNFDEGVNKDIILVEFYAPWCGHCKRLAPEYDEAAAELAKEMPPVPLAKVDCPASGGLCQRFGVSGYPTLKIFRNGALSADYDGPRTASGIASHMRKQSGPSAREVTTIDELKSAMDRLEHSIVGFFSEAKSKLRTAFMSAADKERDNFRFVYSTASEILQEFGFDEQVVVFQPPKMQTKMEPSQLTFDGEPKTNDLVTFIRENYLGLAGVRTTDNGPVFDAKKPLVVVYYDVDFELNPKGSNYWRNRVIKVAKEFVGEVTFSVSDKNTFSKELQDLGFDDDVGVAAGLYDETGKYAMDDEFSVDNLKVFVQQFLDGKLEPYIKSEPIPEDNDGPVTVVVGRNFNEIVNDETKDVLIEFYAPWCGHCKSLAPIYDELGEMLKNDPNIVIAKSDATVNDYSPIYEVRGFPTLFWVPAGKKDSPVKYEGGRELADFIQYIKDNATHPPAIAGDEGNKKKKSKKSKEEL